MPKIAFFLISPVIGAVIGWFTNWLAIRMLFRPRRPVRILGWTLQGVIPRRHAQLAARIAETVQDRLLTQEDLEKAMNGVGWRQEVDHLIHNVLHDRGPGGIIEKIPGLSQAWKVVVLPSLQDVLGREIVRFLDRYRASFVGRLRGPLHRQFPGGTGPEHPGGPQPLALHRQLPEHLVAAGAGRQVGEDPLLLILGEEVVKQVETEVLVDVSHLAPLPLPGPRVADAPPREPPG